MGPGRGNMPYFYWYTSGLCLVHYLNSFMLTILKIEKQQLYQPLCLKHQFDIFKHKISFNMSVSYIMISNWENQEDEDGQHYIGVDRGFYLGNDRKAKENWNTLPSRNY